jgi:hypothetical protein
MGMQFYGVLAAQNKDNAGETLLIEPLDVSRLGPLIDEHPEDIDFFRTLGAITYNKKIFSEKDCENDRQRMAWNRTKVPLLYIEGQLADDEDHPNAKSAAALIRFCARPEIPLKVGLSIDGGILDRRNEAGQPDKDGKVLAKAVALRGSLTHKPCNPKCFLAPMNDLQKSDMTEPPAAYWEALKKSEAKSSFIERPDFKMYMAMEKLKKSITDYMGAFTSMRCKRCGSGVRFFKSSTNIPNGCSGCGTHFTLTDVWSALNK